MKNMKQTMKAQVIYEAGGPEKFVYEDRPIPSVKEVWTLVKVKAFGVNHSEVFTRQGLSPSVTFPRILGIECVGEVVETTREDLSIGQKIVSIMGEMGRAYDGSYAEYTLLPNEQIYTVGLELHWEELATIPETYYTAFGSMKNLHIEEGHTILVRAASSGVGVAFMQLVKAQFPKNRVVGSIRNLENVDTLLQLGFDEIIVDQNGTLQTKELFNRIFELVGPKTIKDTFNHIAEEGIICSTGQLGGQWYLETFDPIIEIKRNSSLTTFYSGNVSQQKIDELFNYIQKWNVTVKPVAIFTLEKLSEAHVYLEKSNTYGKIIVTTQN